MRIMLITELGCTGIGLVWGWWIGNLFGRVTNPILVGLTLFMVSLLLIIEVVVFSGWWDLTFFLGAGGLAFILHIQWRKELINRFGAPNYK